MKVHPAGCRLSAPRPPRSPGVPSSPGSPGLQGLRGLAASFALLGALALCACGDGTPSAAGPSPISRAQAQGTPPDGPPRAGPVAVARGKVEVPGGLLEVLSPLEGTVAALPVAEGDTVRKGQLLAQIANPALEQDAAIAGAELALARSRHRQLEQRIAPARQLVARLDQAERAGAADPVRSDEARQAVREAEAAEAVGAAEVQVAQARLAAAQAQLERRRVVAPADGLVQVAAVQPGARVAAGRPLLQLLPALPMRVRAEVNESFVPSIRAGMRASIVPDGPAQPGVPGVAGKVARVGAMYGPSRLDDEPQARASQRVLECWIELESAVALRAGQLVRVTFHE